MTQISQLFLSGILLLCYLKIHGLGIAYVGALMVSLMAFTRYRETWDKLLVLIGIFVAFVLLHAILSGLTLPSNYRLGQDQTKQMIYSTTNFTIVATTLMLGRRGDPEARTRAIRYILIGMLAIAVLEVYGPLKSAMDAFRSLYTSESSIYTFAERDVQQYGMVRPTVFTSEPSSLGNFFGALWVYFVIRGRRTLIDLAGYMLLLLAAIYIIRSPTLLGYAAVVPGLLLVQARRGLLGYGYLAAILAIFLLVPSYLYTQKGYFSGTLNYFMSTGSFFIRQIAPVLSAEASISLSPFFGAGFSYYEVARDTTYHLLSLLHGGYYDDAYLSVMPVGQYVTNAAWEFVGVYGLFGGIGFAAILMRLFRLVGIVHGPAVILATAVLWTSHAGITLAFTWTPMIIIGLAFYRPRIAAVQGTRAGASLLPSRPTGPRALPGE
ncbi:hypothetical protein CEW88_23475 (plasmid) [Alloyangia pacifica]|uniref:Oligosaccharide repeat unit polymerase n=1 Tax=Alloyangia pacifica TaxID=311180 RepID=A0A2U8HL99_9RHOB|nr:hypothetical protein [Alloyangia pacifica]AWI86729.1 hypothetical protein CEW88_23475 [Alloyangia pacifica]